MEGEGDRKFSSPVRNQADGPLRYRPGRTASWRALARLAGHLFEARLNAHPMNLTRLVALRQASASLEARHQCEDDGMHLENNASIFTSLSLSRARFEV